MADKEKTSEEAGDAGAPKKKSKKLVLILLIVAVLAGGGAGYVFLIRNPARAKAAARKAKATDAAHDQNGEEAANGEPGGGKDKEKGKKGEQSKTSKLATLLPDDEEVKQIVDMPPFILNLADHEENRFLRLSLSLGFGDDVSEKPDQVFTTRARNAVLAVLMTKTSTELLTVDGKAALRGELLDALRSAAKEPQVRAIYITELIVQR